MEVIFNSTIDSASTRIRGFMFTKNCDADILYIQKRADAQTIEKARRSLVPVVYDLDDNPQESNGRYRVTMLGLADFVTTDTELRAHRLRRYAENVRVVPNCIDYIDTPVRAKKIGRVRSVVTFGNKTSVKAASEWVDSYICNKQVMEGIFIKWSLKTFVEDFRKFDLCVLRHDKKNAVKSNVRLIAAMALGVPCVVSSTGSYSDTMQAVGYPDLVTDNLRELPEKVRFVEDHPEISQRCMDYVWSKYSQDASRKIFNAVVKEVCYG